MTAGTEELVGQLRAALADLEEYILRRAQELTEPLVDQVRADAAERIADAYTQGLAAGREALRAQLDSEFIADDGFEQRLRTIMRHDPQLLERWIRQRNRINGETLWLRGGQ